MDGQTLIIVLISHANCLCRFAVKQKGNKIKTIFLFTHLPLYNRFLVYIGLWENIQVTLLEIITWENQQIFVMANIKIEIPIAYW